MKVSKQKAALLAIAAMTVGSTAFAAAPNTDLPNYVVTARRTVTDNLMTPASVTVITRQQIADAHYQNVLQALSSVPGVKVNAYSPNRSNFTSSSVYINGSDKVVVLVNGQRVEANGLLGADPMLQGTANMENVQRIEVVRGSASTLYGADAAGGVINIITRNPVKSGSQTTISGALGTTDFHNVSVYNRGANGKVYWNLGASHKENGNYKLNLEGGNTVTAPGKTNVKAIDLTVGVKADSKNDVSFHYTRSSNDYQRPNNMSQGKFAPVKGWYTNDMASLNWQSKLGEKSTNSLNVYEYRYNYMDGGWGSKAKTLGVNERVTGEKGAHNFVYGLDYYKDTNNETNSISTTAVYGQDDWALTEKVHVVPGLRWEHSTGYGNHFNPSLTVQYLPNATTNVYVAAKRLFVAPNIYQIMATEAAAAQKVLPKGASATLKAETGNEYDFGVKKQLGNTTLADLQVWYRNTDNQVNFVSLSNNNYYYANAGETKAHGVTVTVNHKFNDKFNTNVGYTYTKVEKGDPSYYNGGLPASKWDLGFNYHVNKWTANMSLEGVVGRYGSVYAPNAKKQTSYWVANMNANYEVTSGMKAFVVVNNLFDKKYTASASNLIGPNWYQAEGRSFEAGLSYTF